MKKMIAVALALALALCAALPGVSAAQGSAAPVAASAKGRIGIAAIVNEDVITFSDINNRMQLLLAGTSGNPPDEIRREMEFRALAKLIDEKLEMQEAKSLGIVVTDDQVQTGFSNIAAQNNLPPEEFKRRITADGVPIETLYDQIRAEIAWSQVTRRQLRPQINIAESEIDSELKAIQSGATAAAAPAPAALPPGVKAEPYVRLKQLVMLFDPKDPVSVINAKIARAVALKDEIDGCDAMDKKMQEFKNRGTADLGMGPLNALPPPLKTAVEGLEIGELSKPVRGQNGVAVLMICERSENGAPPPPAADAGMLPNSAQLAAMTPEAQRDAVANGLGLKRMMQMQERYLRDLRATAFIDKRI